MLDDPGVRLDLVEGQPLLGVKDQKLCRVSTDESHTHTYTETKHTFLMRSLASLLTHSGMVMSARAMRLCVMTGVSSKGASPTRNSYISTPRLHRSTFSVYQLSLLPDLTISGGR